ncbi:MAG: hypothetical protein LBO20_10620, partial [Bifidobacteriaceae bacterium]|nr:hypothetical protein [Bifidobacteriaceae bacterium]
QAELRRQALSPTEIESAEQRDLASKRRRMATAVFLAAVAMTGAALFRLIGPGEVVGGALGRLDASVAELLRLAGGDWQATGLGQAGPGDPFAVVLALAKTICLGQGDAAVKAVFLASPLVAAAGAWFAAGAATRSVWLRGWVALAWLAAPPLWTALGDGRLGAATAHAALPWVLLGVARAIGVDRLDLRPAVLADDAGQGRPAGLPPRGSTAAAAAAGLAFAVVAAGSPVLLAPGLASLAVVAVVAGRGRRLRLAWVGLPALALFAPTLSAVAHGGSWRQLAADPGPVLNYTPAAFWLRLAGWSETPLAPAILPAWLTALVAATVVAGAAVAALIGLTRRGSVGRAVRLGWLTAVFGAAVVAASGRFAVTLAGLEPVPVWSGSGASLVLAGLLTAGAAGLDSLVGEPRPEGGRAGRRLRLAGATVGLMALLVGPVLSGAQAVWSRWHHPEVRRSATTQVPPIAAAGHAGPHGVYTLTLALAPGAADARPAVVWDVLRGEGRQLSDAQGRIGARHVTGLPGVLTGFDQADLAIGEAAARMVARNPGPAAVELADAGIGFVQAASGDLELTAALDATPGLARATESDRTVVWQVKPSGVDIPGRSSDVPARLHLIEGDQATALESGPGLSFATEAPDGPAGRTLILAERASPDWRASLDGRPLTALGGQAWQQTFELPAGGGRLEIWRRQPWALWAGQGAVLALAALVALPLRRTASDREDD